MTRYLTPIRIGLAAAAVASLLVIVGVFRGNVPPTPRAVLIALLVGAGAWGLIAWAIAQTAWEVEAAIQDQEEQGDEG